MNCYVRVCTVKYLNFAGLNWHTTLSSPKSERQTKTDQNIKHVNKGPSSRAARKKQQGCSNIIAASRTVAQSKKATIVVTITKM